MRVIFASVNALLAAIVGTVVGKVAEQLLWYLFALVGPMMLECVSDVLGTSSTVILAILLITFVLRPFIAALVAGLSAYGLGRLYRRFLDCWWIAAIIGAALGICVSLAWAYYSFFIT